MEGTMYSPDGCKDRNTCGTMWAYAYFVTFMILGSFVMLNLFITIVLDHFQEADFEDNEMRNFDLLKQWWLRLDPRGTRLLTADQFFVLIRLLPTPMGLGLAEAATRPGHGPMVATDGQLLGRLMHLELPMNEEYKVHYDNVVPALMRLVFQLPPEEAEEVGKFAPLKLGDGSSYCIHHLIAQRTIKRMVARRREAKLLRTGQNGEQSSSPPGNGIRSQPTTGHSTSSPAAGANPNAASLDSAITPISAKDVDDTEMDVVPVHPVPSGSHT
eukprot:NODE_1358_length_1364_cov_62.472918_g1346_i0.p1 GENE.NODE_1358_length_1364_cov_62.472918_g1346_i0~~NODE_1358_length_1364_cov_62.472918_g1346_i0.p1  ORF type:complete len:308 (-),score=68.26 NODE_1358_length_1364_cov_62.472918_g1346_i0:441-1253(-)